MILSMVGAFVMLGVILVVIAVLFAAATVVGMAFSLMRPARMSAGRALWMLRRLTPGDLGIDFEDVNFTVRDEHSGRALKLPGWWMPRPHGGGRCAVLIHGYGDAKIGAIAWAPLLRRLGFNIVAFDLRAHGEAPNGFCTAGYFERHDVSQIIDQLRAEKPAATRQVILFGISLGAAVAAATGAIREDIAAVVLECPFADFRRAVRSFAAWQGMPGPWFQRATMAVAEKLSGADFSAVRPVDMIRQIPCPVMVIQSCDDPFVSLEDVEAIEAAVAARPAERGPSLFWRRENCHHVVSICEDPELYERRLQEFLTSALQVERGHDETKVVAPSTTE